RKGRYSQAGRIYLVTTVTDQRRPLFYSLPLARTVVRTLYRVFYAETLCYCLMPDHLHWLLQLRENGELSQVVQLVKSVSAHAINRQVKLPLPRVWQPGFDDHALRKEEDVRAVARYVVANPLRAGLVQRIGDYPHWNALWL